MLASFARLMYRRRRSVVVAWIALLVAAIVAAGAFGGDHRVDYSIPGSDSARAQELLAERFPVHSGDAVQLVFHSPDGVRDPATASAIAAAHDAARAIAHVTAVHEVAVSDDGTTALASVQLDATAEKVPMSTIEAIMDLAGEASATSDGLTVEAGGAAVQEAEAGEPGSEQIGMIAALVILLLAFGSLVAAGLPILTALFGIGVALSSIEILKRVLVVPDWAPQIVTMIGIGVGIDYALFIVTRYRAALADGADPEDAVVIAVTTAGRAVLFAGATVVISLTGLCTMGLEYLYGTAAATVVGVLFVMAASLTLLPAVLGFAGRSLDRWRVPFVRGDRADGGLWARWSRVVQRRPVATGLCALVAIVALAAPATDLRFGNPDAGTGPTSLTSRRAFDLVTDAFGPGANSPIVLAVDVRGDDGVLDRLLVAVGAEPAVASVSAPIRNEFGDAAVVSVTSRFGPQHRETEDLIVSLRDEIVPTVSAGGDAEVFVGGASAAFLDESDYVGARLPLLIGTVIAVSFVLLLVVFRALLVAVKAALMNIITIGAAYGLMAVALSGGWLGQAIGIDTSTPIPAWAPMMMFALLFGLSMDYEVFLLSRIREEYVRTGDNSAAVAHGIARTGRVITAAALIMVTVFGAFMLSDLVLLKVIGLGMASAVLLDATVVRMIVVPSSMELLGDRNWWLPRWLDRALPRLDIEGDPTVALGLGVERSVPAAHPAGDPTLGDQLVKATSRTSISAR